jgi:ABC-type polysaccharide/polyol phosphate transport system ATPase subunit
MEQSENNQVVDVKNLTKTYNLYTRPIDRLKETFNPFGKKYHTTVNSIHEVTFSVSKGDIVGIIGKNGSGKSTLLKIIAGVLTPTSGRIEIKGRISSILELGTGFNPEFTGIENIYHMGLLMGYSQEQMDKKIQYIQDFADIGNFINQPVKIYSSGMYVRLAFAVAINVEPDILIVDEVLAVGDINFQTKCMSKFKQLIESGVTVLLVTHDTNTVKALCSKCLYLKGGETVAFGSAQDIVDMYLHDMRNEMNEVNSKQPVHHLFSLQTFKPEDEKCDLIFKPNEIFDKNVSLFRQGTGEAKIRNVELLDGDGKLINSVTFNQGITIRIYIEFYKDIQLGVCYHIRDSKNIEIAGSDTYIESNALIEGKHGQKIIVDFNTDLEIIEGNYNLFILLTKPVIYNRTAVFIDSVENAYLFTMQERSPAKIWDKVYLKSKVTIYNVK